MKWMMRRWYILVFSFVEGMALMATELISAKLIAPYFGTSLYVWASVLGVTLGGLLLGYWLGGVLSVRYPHDRTLVLVGIAASVWMFLFPLVGKVVMGALLGWELRVAILLSCCVFLLPAMVIYGLVSPVAVRLLAAVGAGRSAGVIYGISTMGGVLAVWVFAFRLIPFVGVRESAWVVSAGMVVVSLLVYLFSDRRAGKG